MSITKSNKESYLNKQDARCREVSFPPSLAPLLQALIIITPGSITSMGPLEEGKESSEAAKAVRLHPPRPHSLEAIIVAVTTIIIAIIIASTTSNSWKSRLIFRPRNSHSIT